MKKFLLLFLLSTNLMAQGDPAPFIKGQASTGLGNVGSTIFVPENQSTRINAYQALVETGNYNLLVNPSFEHQTVTTGWTSGTGNVLTATTLASTRYSGLKAGSLTTNSTVAFDFKQCVTPISGVSTGQGEASIALAVPSGVTDAQVCSQVNNVDQNCTPAINDGRYYPYKIPMVFGTPGQNACIKIKTTATYASGTQTILVDDAQVRVGLPTSILQGDVVYTAIVSATGTILNTSKTGWISCTSSSPYTCTFPVGQFSQTPSCQAIDSDGASLFARFDSQNNLQVVMRTLSVAASPVTGNAGFNITCVKTGIDYTAATGNAYQSINADSPWVPCSFPSMSWQGFGTVTNVSLQCKRSGDNMLMKGSFTGGTVVNSIVQIPFPNNWGVVTSSSASVRDSFGSILLGGASENVILNTISSPGQSYFNVSNAIASSILTANPITAVTGTVAVGNNQIMTISGVLVIPISGWSQSGSIVGSFVGVPTVPGLSAGQKVDTFSLSFGSANAGTQSVTPCTSSPCALDQIGTAVTSVTRSVTGSYSVNFARTYIKAKCSGSSAQSNNQGQQLVDFSCLNCNSLPISIGTPGTAAYDSHPNLICQGSY